MPVFARKNSTYLKFFYGILGILSMIALLGIFSCMRKDQIDRPVLVCIGDSLTSCGGPDGHYTDALAHLLPNLQIIDAGISGNTLEDGKVRFEQDVMTHDPDIVLIALGANDFWENSRPVSEMAQDLEGMIAQAQSNQCEVIVAGCLGDRSFWDELCPEFSPNRFQLAQHIAKEEIRICKQYGCIYLPNFQVDIKPNRLPPFWDETDHPNSLGNEQVALRILPSVQLALARKSYQ